MWPGFAALADRFDGPVVVYTGPGERFETCHPTREGLPLDQLAACLERAAALVSNDSGLAHFARAVGVRTVVVFGSTSPARTGPAGCVPVEGPDLPCRPCYRKRCPYPGVPCLDIPVAQVEAALRQA
ncbi:MAG: glycosyltransferase family 9 protein [Alphaproteobacteria bacterium]|nr:glycosyltransferase family 9 protein [Alphaproteobacteria bacterium]